MLIISSSVSQPSYEILFYVRRCNCIEMFIMLMPYILTFVERDSYLDVYLQVSFYKVGQKQGLKLQYSIYIFV